MSQGFINISVSGSGSVGYYLREGECLAYYHSNGNLSKTDVLADWKRIESDEKLGNKALGIRGRHDAQVRKNYTLSMPNSLSPESCLERMGKLIEGTAIKNCTYTIAVHRGEKDGIVNQHVHLLVNERDLRTMKKDREMIKKSWLEQTFRPSYQSVFAKEFSEGKEVGYRERIEVGLYESDKEFSRSTIKEMEEIRLSQSQASEAPTLDFLQDFAALLRADKEAEESLRLAEAQRREQEKQESKEQQRGRGFGMSF